VLRSPAFGLVGVGFALAIWVVSGVLLGRYLDGRWDTQPVLTLVFLALGLSLGCYDAYRRLRLVMASVESKSERKGKP
jgi:F0F1-type ATP synthase assembly protein I